jgi:Cft2 family RNA processing exonuclease
VPLYTAADAVRSLDSFISRDFDAPFPLPGGIEATFLPAGHILGAAQVHLKLGGRTVHFTGDLGRANDCSRTYQELSGQSACIIPSPFRKQRVSQPEAKAALRES